MELLLDLELESMKTNLYEHILNGNIDELEDLFDEENVSLSVYVVPRDYTVNKNYIGDEVDFSKVNNSLFYCGDMKYENGKYYLKNSRAFAICAKAPNIEEARKIVYNELEKVKGNIYYRKDIGNVN